MKEQLYILFCQNPLDANEVDPDYKEEFLNAKQSGLEILTMSFDDLIAGDRSQSAVKRIKKNETLHKVIYRGWMLTGEQYATLYSDLFTRNYELINTPAQYLNCHYLPESLRFIESRTPKTVFQKFENTGSIDALIEKTKVFGQNAVVIKDYVKSEKHDWETACFVSNAADTEKLKRTIKNLLTLRGKYLNEGIVVREFIKLNDLTTHSKSGMPLTEEYRLFFCNKKLIGIYDYWEEGEYKFAKPDTTEFEKIAQQIDSNFFSMDIARKQDGELIIIELGDGQVAGLPDKTDKKDFYNKLRNHF